MDPDPITEAAYFALVRLAHKHCARTSSPLMWNATLLWKPATFALVRSANKHCAHAADPVMSAVQCLGRPQAPAIMH